MDLIEPLERELGGEELMVESIGARYESAVG